MKLIYEAFPKEFIDSTYDRIFKNHDLTDPKTMTRIQFVEMIEMDESITEDTMDDDMEICDRIDTYMNIW